MWPLARRTYKTIGYLKGRLTGQYVEVEPWRFFKEYPSNERPRYIELIRDYNDHLVFAKLAMRKGDETGWRVYVCRNGSGIVLQDRRGYHVELPINDQTMQFVLEASFSHEELYPLYAQNMRSNLMKIAKALETTKDAFRSQIVQKCREALLKMAFTTTLNDWVIKMPFDAGELIDVDESKSGE